MDRFTQEDTNEYACFSVALYMEHRADGVAAHRACICGSQRASANDPPVKVYSATLAHGNGVAGNATGINVVIADTTFAGNDILTVPVDFTGQTHNHYCAVIASANVINPGNGTGHVYEFGVGYDASNADTFAFSNMFLDLSDNAGVDDPSWWPVTVNRVFPALTPATHTIRFQARKRVAGDPNFTIDNASMTVLCFKKYQTMLAAPEPETPPSDNPVNDE